MNDSSLVSRIRLILDWQQLSSTQFADRIKVGRPVVSHILSERNKPSLDVVQAILTAFPELSMAWLLQGAGSMLNFPAEPAQAPAAAPAPLAPALPAAAPAASYASSTPAAGAASPAPSAAPVLPAASAGVKPASSPAASLRPPISRFTPARFRAPQPGSAAGAEPTQPPPTPATVAERAPVLPELPATSAASAPTTTSSAVEPLTAVNAAEESTTGSPVAQVASGPATASASDLGFAQAFVEPGKAIRRIVIFYRDGSFADYQPEA